MISLSAGIAAAVVADHTVAFLVKIEFTTPVYLTDANHSIAYGGNTYLGNGVLTGLDAINEKAEVSTDELRIQFSGANQSIITAVLANQQINRFVTIYRAYLSGASIIDNPIEVWKGRITSNSISDGNGEATVQLTVGSEWADFEKIIGRRTTTASQQKHFSTDVGLEFAGKTSREIKWGR